MLRFSDANAKTANLYSVEGLRPFLEGGRKVYSLDLLSGVNCPGAKDCHSWAKLDTQTGKYKIQDGKFTQFRCFSASQEVQYPALRALRTANMVAIKDCGNSAAKIATLIRTELPSDLGVLRFHVGGDFFSVAYMAAAVGVAAARPDCLFYFYTKSLHHLEVVVKDVPSANLSEGVILPNLRVTGSRGGRFDHLLGVLGLRQAVVVYDENTPLPIDHDDSHAASPGGDFALLIHGTQPKGSDAAKALSTLKGKGAYSR